MEVCLEVVEAGDVAGVLEEGREFVVELQFHPHVAVAPRHPLHHPPQERRHPLVEH